MKYFMLFLILFISACAASDITVNRDAMKSVKIIAITPFTSRVDLKKEILKEAEDNFKAAFVKMDYKVIETDKLKEKDNGLSVFTAENVKRTGRSTGAGAVLYGEVAVHEEETKEIPSYRRHGSFISTLYSEDRLKYETFYRFRIIVRLVNVSDGKEMLMIKNSYKEIRQDENLQCCNSLDAYRKYTLKKMADDLIEAMKEKN